MNIRVADSSIHGRGVFASEKIPKGRWQYIYGEVHAYIPDAPGNLRCFWWGEEESVFNPYEPWCYLNHSDDPNCDVGGDTEPGSVLILTALRTIKPHEELTINYGYDPSTC